jgi:hypothetical protein
LKRHRVPEASNSEASNSESSTITRHSGANWTVGGKLARLGGELKGNPFKAVADLIPHEELKMKHDVPVRGMAENMLHFQACVSVL